MRIWLDDIRTMPSGFDIHITTSIKAMELVLAGKVHFISFDHDLGGDDTGYAVACCIEAAAYNSKIPRMDWTVHSANPVGHQRITNAMIRADYFWEPQHCVHCGIWFQQRSFQGAGDGTGNRFKCHPACEGN